MHTCIYVLHSREGTSLLIPDLHFTCYQTYGTHWLCVSEEAPRHFGRVLWVPVLEQPVVQLHGAGEGAGDPVDERLGFPLHFRRLLSCDQ